MSTTFHTLSINIAHGRWSVDIIDEHLDDGVYELVAPVRTVEVSLDLKSRIYGFSYSVVAKPETEFVITLDDTELVCSKVDHSGYCRGRGIV